MLLYWVWFVAFLVAATVVDRWVKMTETTRLVFRVVVLVLAVLWILKIVGVLARIGF